MNIFLAYFLNITVQIGLIWLIYQWVKKIIEGHVFLLSVLFKLGSGILLGILFFKYYQYGDTILYYQSAMDLASAHWTMFWHDIFEPTITSDSVRAIYFTRVLAVLLYFTHGDYWLVSVYFSIGSLFGAFYFIKQISYWQKSFVLPATIAFLLLPSVVFWTSGIIKESLAFGAMLLITGVYVKYKSKEAVSVYDFFMLGLGILVLALFKYYILGVVLPILMFLLIYDQLQIRQWLLEGIWRNVSALTLLLLLPIYFFLSWLHPNFDLTIFSDILQMAHNDMIANSKTINAIPALDWLTSDLLNYIINIFYFLFSGLFRPLFPENLSFPGVFSSAENLVIMVLFLWKIFSLEKPVKFTVETFAILSYVAILALFLTYSIPNLGALVRFKVYYLPFFVFFILVYHPLWTKWKITNNNADH